MKTTKASLLTLIVGIILPAALHAQEIPEEMGYAGELARDGEPFTGPTTGEQA